MSEEAVTLREIDRDNWEEIIKLKLADEQTSFVASNVYSLAESKFFPNMLPLAIYAGERPVGFVMFGQHPDPRDQQYWIYRLMIDAGAQQRGYGRAAMEQVITRMTSIPGCHEIVIGYEPDNTVAARLYASLDFREAEIAPWGEQLARLRV